ncbi:biotin/lipoyl-containing protein [Eubacterium ruminantium]|uniref:Biotin-requiring enzyme n=1 Tax=Eubacterium ruminantium TaxID=42322 RepID=A0A1T4LXE5_9FIRM|nr:biotin/lipoyl-containing protein [Eubacterium ruminantium]SCW38714.1 Biotin-requiring enzyme [Eubacterium ruminantium]SDM43791.1 Biotin-requiring enzyme [Eubacterium ruminantium]SJZ59337.1 Biotin-requiring enzyme [Eubacterium ruminantium]
MKNYRITVNGTTYDVAVEEADGSAVSAAPAPKAAAPAPKAAAPAPKPAAPAASGSAGSVVVAAPMPGKILGVKVDSGKAVKKGEVLLILEAMKMENEIVAPQDGTVASVNVQVGSQVEAGDTLVTLN